MDTRWEPRVRAGARLAWLLVVMALAGVPSIALAAEEIWKAHASGIIEVGTDGTVQSYKVRESVGAKMDAPLTRYISGWRFHPVVVDGKAIPVRARVDLVLVAVKPEGKGVKLAVEQTRFYELAPDSNRFLVDTGSHLVAPKYPVGAAGAGVAADVVMRLAVDPEGNVVDSELERLDLRTTGLMPSRQAKKYASQFQAAIRPVLPWWRIGAGSLEFRDGLAQVRVPVVFHLEGLTWGRWQAIVEPPPGKVEDGVEVADLGASGAPVSLRLSLLEEPGELTGV